MDPIKRLPNEMQYEIISYLPIQSILAARCASSSWKTMISRNFTDFVCQISDESYPFVPNATEIFPTVKFFDLSLQKEKNVVSSTRSVGRIISNAQKLVFIGDNIEASQVKKILRYCVNIEELIFQRCTVSIMMTTLGLPSSHPLYYQNLSKLTFQFKGLPTPDQTQILKSLATLGNASLTVLYHLSLQWTYKRGDPYIRFKASRARSMFENYLATVHLITSVRRTLKSLEINRCPRVMLNMWFGWRHFTTNSYLMRAKIHKCIQNLGELKLNVLKLTILPIEGRDPWILEHALLQGQSSLKELTVIKKTCANFQRSFLPQTLENLLPVNVVNLTTVNLAMTIHGVAPINLTHFAQCKNLKSLRLSGHCYLFAPEDEWTSSVSELCCLPNSLQSLHFTPPHYSCNSSCEDNRLNGRNLLCSRFYRESYLMLTSSQIEWIVKNLVNLKSFGCLLIVVETNEEKMVDLGVVQVPAFEFNGDANMDLDLFKNLMGMKTVKCFELNMLRAGQLIRFGEDARRMLFSEGNVRREFGEYINCGRREMGYEVKTKVIPQRYMKVIITK